LALSRYTLDFEIDFEFELIGIASALPGYKVAWHLNRALEISMYRVDDHVIDIKEVSKNGELSFEENSFASRRYSRYSYELPHEDLHYKLISFKSQGQLLSNEIKGYDYVLKIESPEEKASQFINRLNKIDAFSIVSQINTDQLDLEFISDL